MRGTEKAMRHPHAGWVPDRNGNPSEQPLFGDDVPVDGVAFASTGTSEPTGGATGATVWKTDSTVLETADLYLPFGTPNGPHDEWTARGRRWRQVGIGEDWIGLSGRRFGTRIHLVRRTG